MDALNTLLRQTIATTTADEVCFIYIPNERINSTIFATRFGNAEVEGDGVTYSLDKTKLELSLKSATAPLAMMHSWTLSVTPFAERTITSVAVPAQHKNPAPDRVIATFLPELAAQTVGMTVVHFFERGEAEAFKQGVERRAEVMMMAE